MKNKLIILFCVVFVFGCQKSDIVSETDIVETAQQVGDLMASVDEAGGSSGTLAFNESVFQKTFNRYAPGDSIKPSAVAFLFLPKAQAISCSGAGFGSCSGRTVTRNFNECTIGSSVLSGDVSLVWSGSGAGCSLGSGLPSGGDAITRTPSFTLTGRRGATLSVSKSGATGQKLTYVSGTSPNFVFNLTNGGIRRKFTTAESSVLFDHTTSVTSPITITGNARTNRVMNGGFLQVTNNLTSVICNYSPSNVTWNTSACNCPTQGSWSGSCSDGKSATLEITGCGTADYTEGTDVQSVTFDRCGT